MAVVWRTTLPSGRPASGKAPVVRRSEGEVARTWRAYALTRDPDLRNWLAENYFPLVRRFCHSVLPNIPFSVQEEDLLQIGRVRLIQCVEEYHKDRGPFEGYAAVCIRGAILDHLRKE